MDSGKQAQLVHGNKDDQLVLFISGPAEQLFFHASQFVYAVDDWIYLNGLECSCYVP